MPIIRHLLCAAAIGLCAMASSFAAEPNNGVEYLTLPEAQNTDAANKVVAAVKK